MLEFLKRFFGLNPLQQPAPYLIEFRLYRSSKHFTRKISRELVRRFKVKQSAKQVNPAHITLFGPFNTHDEYRLIQEFEKFCSKYDLIQYSLGGFDHINKEVIYLDVEPSQELVEFRRELAHNFMRFTTDYPLWDKEPDFIFHTTLTKDFGDKFEAIWNYLSRIHASKRDQYMLRVCLLKNRSILFSYDLFQRKMLSRDAELSEREMDKTINLVLYIRKNGGKRNK